MPATALTLPRMAPDPHFSDVSDSDQDLLRRYFIYQDQDAMERLFKRHADTAFRVALREMRNSVDAEEIVQAAFLNVLTKGNERISNVRGWIMGIVVNACRNQIKEELRRRKRHELAAKYSVNEETASGENAEMIAAVLRQVLSLPEHYRLPVTLHFIDGLPFQEVAFALARPEETVRKQVSRGIEQVRKSLATAGFTASVGAIPELLVSSPLPSAPTTLTASFKTMIAGGAAKGSGVAAETAAAAAKSSVIATTSKVSLIAALLLTVVAAVTTAFHVGHKDQTKQDAGRPPAASSPASVVALTTNKSLSEILDKKIDVIYRREYLCEVLDDLDKRVGLRSALAHRKNVHVHTGGAGNYRQTCVGEVGRRRQVGFGVPRG